MTITTRVPPLNDPQGLLQTWGPLIREEDHLSNLQTVLKQRTSRTEILFDPHMPELLHNVIVVTEMQWETIGTGTANLWKASRFRNNRSANKKVRGRPWDPSRSVIPYKGQVGGIQHSLNFKNCLQLNPGEIPITNWFPQRTLDTCDQWLLVYGKDAWSIPSEVCIRKRIFMSNVILNLVQWFTTTWALIREGLPVVFSSESTCLIWNNIWIKMLVSVSL